MISSSGIRLPRTVRPRRSLRLWAGFSFFPHESRTFRNPQSLALMRLGSQSEERERIPENKLELF